MPPKISIIVINYNGYFWLQNCLNSIYRSSYTSYEIIVVDNGSTDNSAKKIKQSFPQVTLLLLNRNFGPAYARNVALKKTKGQYIAFFDNDTRIDRQCLQKAVRTFTDDPKLGIIQCKLALMNNPKFLDSTGEYLGQNGFLVHRTEMGDRDCDSRGVNEIIFSAKSAGMIVRRDVIRQAGGFDNDYFIYLEETDLAWRVWLQGFTVKYFAACIVLHQAGTSSLILSPDTHNYHAKFHGTKNYLLTLLKNLQAINLIKIVPVHLTLWIGLAYFALFRRQWQTFYWIHKAVFWNIRHIGQTWEKRRIIQKQRRICDSDLFPIIMKKQPFWYYLNKIRSKPPVGLTEGFFRNQ